jgi:aminoglycoside phosphotransferase family enzyme/predicted kinase
VTAVEDDQKAVLDFLGGRREVKRVDTHISVVFLEPERVLKVKRAIRLPYLDYATLQKRKEACDAELAINRRFAPAIYRRVVPITREPAGPAIDGGGPVIEWAVEMARFDERNTFDHLAATGTIGPSLAEHLADTLRASHERADVARQSSWPQSIAGLIDRNTEKFRSHASLDRRSVEQLDALSRRKAAALRAIIEQRAVDGMVRRCHGDAHLANIVLIDNAPVLFDAIEFDPAIATTDLLYDLAFPLMDLLHFGQGAAANRLFNRYFEASWRHNGSALGLMPLFLSIRAAIRAHVLLTRCEQSPHDASAADGARAYFDLALRLIAPAPPALVAIGGRSGTGKSVLARAAAGLIEPMPGALVLRSDVIRKEMFGVGPLEKLPEPAYAPDVTESIYRMLCERARQAVGQGCSVIVDAAYLRESERAALGEEARRLGVAFFPLFLDAPSQIRFDRVATRRRDASDATREVAERQERMDLGPMEWPVIDASGAPEETLQRARRHLPNPIAL